MKTLLCIVVGSCTFAASAVAATHATPAKCINQYQPNQTAAEADACAALATASAMVKPLAIPIANSKAVAKAAFTGDNNTVWNYMLDAVSVRHLAFSLAVVSDEESRGTARPDARPVLTSST